MENTEIILIEEIQFFEDTYCVIKHWVDTLNKTVICAGLDGDYSRTSFGDMYKLYPISDKINKISSLCIKCGDETNAPFTNRKIHNNYSQRLKVVMIFMKLCVENII